MQVGTPIELWCPEEDCRITLVAHCPCQRMSPAKVSDSGKVRIGGHQSASMFDDDRGVLRIGDEVACPMLRRPGRDA